MKVSMNSLANILFLHCPDVVIEEVSLEGNVLIFSIQATQVPVQCPVCASPSTQVHGSYVRKPADLPCLEYAVRLHLRVRRFLCQNSQCERKTFAESFPGLVLAHARRTIRQTKRLCALAFVLGGKPASSIAETFQCSASRDTLLRLLRRSPLPATSTPRVLGLDDWAWRKGRRYGTILCDLERHRPIDLLPDRDADTVVAWLKAHPGVQIISRDRSSEYADAARRGAPQAIQVADRFHLIKNLGDDLETALKRYRDCFRFTDAQETSLLLDQPQGELPAPQDIRPVPTRRAEEVRLAHREERRQRYEQIVTLREQGLTIKEIASRLPISRSTVERFLAASSFPEKMRRRKEKTKLDAYRLYLFERWQVGCHNAAHLHQEIAGRGYQGSYASVCAYIRCLHQGVSLPETPRPPSVRQLSIKHVHFLFLRHPTDLKPQEQQDLEEILHRSADLASIYQLVQHFREMLHARNINQLNEWVQQVLKGPCPELQSFVAGLRKDWDAVRTAITLEWSNGMVEGQVNRLKLIKRQMYGRANFDLLRLRVLHRDNEASHTKCARTI
jgi:transposase